MNQKWIGCLLALLLLLTALPGAAQEENVRYVCITVKDYGEIYAELYPEIAPITVENFLGLVHERFYDGLTFHRIISGFMIQGGDPQGNGTGGSEKQIKGEFSSNGVENPLSHRRGVLSMARSSLPDSASSQFFIMHQDSTYLDGNYAAFGTVRAGLWIVDKICQGTPVQDNNGTVLKADQPVILSIRESDRAAVEEAVAAEAANGASGTVYHDPLTPLSFPVPQGWYRDSDAAAQSLFVSDSAPEKPLFFLRYNQWDNLSSAYKQYFAQQGITRESMDTTAFKRESLIGMVSSTGEGFTEETRSGVLFYTGEAAANGGSTTYYVGAHDAYIYLFAFGGAKTDPLFADVLSILDQLNFE